MVIEDANVVESLLIYIWYSGIMGLLVGILITLMEIQKRLKKGD
jgi:hypothetical protein